MRARLLLAVVLAFSPCLSVAQIAVADGNSVLTVNIDQPGFNLFTPSDPVQLPRTIEWTVDGRRILVYPSGPWQFIDVGHFHHYSHVGTNQIHAQGPMLGFATSDLDGTVIGGAVYSVHGGAAGSGASRITEKVDIHNKTSAHLPVSLTGMGFKPTQVGLEVPDYADLAVTGTTTVFFQGNAATYSIADASLGFGPVMVLPVVSFSDFNPLFNEAFSIPPGAVLTMITELNVRPRVRTLCDAVNCTRFLGFELPDPPGRLPPPSLSR